MKFSSSKNPKEICEGLLHEEKRYNQENNTLPSKNAVVDRLLARGDEMKDIYKEIFDKLNDPLKIKTFLEIILNTAAFWSPKRIQDQWAARDGLKNINRQIANTANELAMLLKQRSDLHNKSGFSDNTYYHVYDVIEAASIDNGHFKSFLQEPLGNLRGRFDLKYWPSLSECMQEISSDAAKASVVPTNALADVSTDATRHSQADFLKAFLRNIAENEGIQDHELPKNFKLKDNSIANICNCALNLDVSDLTDADYVKRFRQRERDKIKQ
jgi:hypothetical protein